jgi:predicted AlkP superfamily pyrophosphatase or phosphodiesterase
MPFLDYTLREPMMAPGALGVPTIFDLLTKAGMKWSYISSASLKRDDLLNAVANVDPDSDLVFVYLHQVDMASHLWGIESPRFWKAVEKTDALTGEVLKRARARIGEHHTLIFSDHGMSQIRKWVAIPELLSHPDFGTKFCCALDATLVRVWYLDDDPKLRTELRDLVAGRFPGRWLEEQDLVDLHVHFSDRRYGDEMYLIEQGTVVHPNFHSYLRPKAMHAYHPDEPEQQGILIASAVPAASVGTNADMIDIAPLIGRLCNLPEPIRTNET